MSKAEAEGKRQNVPLLCFLECPLDCWMARRPPPRSDRSCCRRSRRSARGRAARPRSTSCSSATDPASQIYVRNKERAGGEAGLGVTIHGWPTTVDRCGGAGAGRDAQRDRRRATASSCSRRCRRRWAKADAQQVFDAIDPAKDVDGFHPQNVGLLVQGRPTLAPCTPSGVIELLERERSPIAGQHAVVIGRSEIVGKPMALLLLQRDATVTICHSKTRDLPAVARDGGHPRRGDRPRRGS